jgi:hypothetical protein
MRRSLVLLVLSAFMLSGPAMAADAMQDLATAANPEARAFLPADLVAAGVTAWQADGRSALYVQSGNGGAWYHVQLMEPCLNLPYTTIINFITDGSQKFSEFTSILVRGQRCWFKSVEPSDAPPKPDKQG